MRPHISLFLFEPQASFPLSIVLNLSKLKIINSASTTGIGHASYLQRVASEIKNEHLNRLFEIIDLCLEPRVCLGPSKETI